MDLRPLSLYLFTLYLLTCAFLVLCVCSGWATLSLCFCWMGSFAPLSPTPLPHSIPAARCRSSSVTPITGPFTKLNQLTLAEAFLLWVNQIGAELFQPKQREKERERVDDLSKKWGEPLEDREFSCLILLYWFPLLSITSWYLGTLLFSRLSGGTSISNTTPSAWNKASAPTYFKLSTAKLAPDWPLWQSVFGQWWGHVYGHSFCQLF